MGILLAQSQFKSYHDYDHTCGWERAAGAPAGDGPQKGQLGQVAAFMPAGSCGAENVQTAKADTRTSFIVNIFPLCCNYCDQSNNTNPQIGFTGFYTDRI